MPKLTLSPFSVLAAISTIGLAAALAAGSAHATQNNNGGSADGTTCEVVSVGNWYCTIDGKGYYCTKKDNPDKNKDCMPARVIKGNPAAGRINGSVLKAN